MELLNDAGAFEQTQSSTGDAAWQRAQEIRNAARKALVEVDGRERLNRAVRARPRRQREEHEFQEGDPVYVWRQGKRGTQAKVGPCFVVLQKGSAIWVTRRGELWRCNKTQVFPMENQAAQGLESIPAELLRVKERLRFHPEKQGYVDVEKEGDPPEAAYRDTTPAPTVGNTQRRAPGTPRAPRTPRPAPRTPVFQGPPEGLKASQSIPAPATPAIVREIPMTPVPVRASTPEPPTTEQAGDTADRSRSPAPRASPKHQTSSAAEQAANSPAAAEAPAVSMPQGMREADELWKATVENQRSRSSASTGPSTHPTHESLRSWTRYDLEAKRYRGSNSKGPIWSDVLRRLTLDIDKNKVIQDLTITDELSVHKLHEKLPEGVKNIETTLIYRPKPGNPDPGKPYEALLPQPESQPVKKARLSEPHFPEEDARLTDVKMTKSFQAPSADGRVANRSRIFGMWRADDVTEWGDKRKFPVVASSRDLRVFHKLEHKDMMYALREPEFSLAYLTKQSGKELDERKLNNVEKEMFSKAKTLEITNLVNSNAIQIIIDEQELARIWKDLPHRIMPSLFIITKKAGEVGEDWKAKARWILLGHKDPDAMTQERFAPTPSSTMVMLCLQIISSMQFELYIMDVSSAFGQSDPHERAEGPLYASMPPTGILGYEKTALIRVLTAVYGLVNAPAVWRKTVRRHLTELGYQESVFDPCLYYLPPNDQEINNGPKLQVAGVVLLDVDAFCQGGNERHQKLMTDLRGKLKFCKWRNVYNDTAEYIGRTLRQLPTYEIQVSMKRYVEEKLKPVTLPRERLRDKAPS